MRGECRDNTTNCGSAVFVGCPIKFCVNKLPTKHGLLARHSCLFPLVSAVLPEVSLVMRAAGVNDATGFREPYRQRGILLHSLSVLKKNPQLIRHHVPVSTNYRPVIHDILRRKIQHFPQGVIVGK